MRRPKEYYRQRASQYPDWAHRTGQYEEHVEPEASWFEEAMILIEALASSGLSGDVLEIASGTGIWTEELLRNAASVTALDSSPEMHERSRSRLMRNPKVRYVVADIYDWVPDMSYDAVTFSFWLSHVPRFQAGRLRHEGVHVSETRRESILCRPEKRGPET